MAFPTKNPMQSSVHQGDFRGTQKRDTPYASKKTRGGYGQQDRVHTFDRQPARSPAQSFSFTGRGFLPDFHNSHGLVTFHEASTTTLENEGVHGREGMLPAGGSLARIQKTDSGSGGAGSFNTVPAFQAKVNG